MKVLKMSLCDFDSSIYNLFLCLVLLRALPLEWPKHIISSCFIQRKKIPSLYILVWSHWYSKITFRTSFSKL